jgi:hypothetical protein
VTGQLTNYVLGIRGRTVVTFTLRPPVLRRNISKEEFVKVWSGFIWFRKDQ